MPKPHIYVAAGVLMATNGTILLCSRPDDKPWAGWWELPGGKIEAGETVLDALARELHEELGITVTDANPWVCYVHDYPKTIVHLNFCQVRGWTGKPTGLEGQQLAWIHPGHPLSVGPVLPATEPPLRWLQLPERYLITSITQPDRLPDFLELLKRALSSRPHLVQFREPSWETRAQQDPAQRALLLQALHAVLAICKQHDTSCLINSCHPDDWWQLASGVHWRSTDAHRLQHSPHLVQGLRYSALSAHNETDIALAQQLNVDFIVLGHVLPTPSHPGQPALGWTRFADLARTAGRPVYAIGGQSDDSLPMARHQGAHGIAGIRHLIGTAPSLPPKP